MSATSYEPLPALLPTVLDYASSRLKSRAAPPAPYSPLGLRDAASGQGGPSSLIVTIPTDLLVSAWRLLFPAERMVLLGGRVDEANARVTSATDVTGERRSSAYVRASALR